MKALAFKKSERLRHKKSIQELFSKGSSFYLYPFKVFFVSDEASSCHQVLISIPKRNFKKAVHRNLLKRRVREAYRHNKHMLDTDSKFQIAYIYTSKELLDYKIIEKKLIESFIRLKKQLPQ